MRQVRRAGRRGVCGDLPLAMALVALCALHPTPAGAAAAKVRSVDLGGLEARSAALLLSGQETAGLEASFLSPAAAATPAGTSVPLVVDLVGASLLEAATGAEMILEVYAYALDDGGQPRATLTRAFRLDLSTQRPLLEAGGVKFLGRMLLPTGAVADSLRLLVLHRASGRFALRTLPVAAGPTAGEEGEEAVAGTPPLVLENGRSWLVASAPDDEWPAAVGADLLPATRLVATAGGSLSFGLAAGDDTRNFVGRLVDAGGQTLGEPGLTVARAADSGPSTRQALLDLSSAAPGSYLLELAADGEAGAALRLPLELVPEPLAPGTAWFQRPPPLPAEQPADTRAAARGSSLQRAALVAYRRAFEAWDAGDLGRAIAELRRFEVASISTDVVGNLPIQEGQLRAAAALARADGEALVPLMCLHEKLFRFYRSRESFLLATHSRRMASELARLYAGRGGDEAGRIAALVPVSLAGVRQEIGTRIAAQSTFERALELDPRQPAALLGLAALHESFGHYDTTVELLQRLERSGPLSPEAGIRLAVNLGRVGSERRALALLQELAEAPPGWISRLAYQEWARLLAGGQRAEKAVSVLAAARQRYPDDQGLIIQQAALLDRLGRPLAGHRLLAAVDELTGDRGASPRLRYSALPSNEIEAARARLAQAAVERLAGVLESARQAEVGGAP